MKFKTAIILSMCMLALIFIVNVTPTSVNAGSVRSMADLTTVLNAEGSSLRDFRAALGELTSIRSPEACLVLIGCLRREEVNLPTALPSLQDLAALETSLKKGTLPTNHWMFHLSRSLEVVVSLTQVDEPEATSAVANFMKDLTQKYGSADTGKTVIDLFRAKIAGAREDVKRGVVPWQTYSSKQSVER